MSAFIPAFMADGLQTLREASAGMNPWTVLTIVGLTAITVITRSFFFIFQSQWTLPAWVERGLRYAPIAALAAVVVPEVLSTQGQLSIWWRDARVYSALACVLCYAVSRQILLSIVAGTLVYLPLRVGLGW